MLSSSIRLGCVDMVWTAKRESAMKLWGLSGDGLGFALIKLSTDELLIKPDSPRLRLPRWPLPWLALQSVSCEVIGCPSGAQESQ